jgi:hypothetical protein
MRWKGIMEFFPSIEKNIKEGPEGKDVREGNNVREGKDDCERNDD